MHAIDDYGAYRFQIHMLAFNLDGLGRGAMHLGKAKEFADGNERPARIEFPGLNGKLGRAGEGMVIVVQLFAANEKAKRHDIGGGIRAFKIAITEVVTQAVDDARGQHREGQHLNRENQDRWHAEQEDVDQRHADDAGIARSPPTIPRGRTAPARAGGD